MGDPAPPTELVWVIQERIELARHIYKGGLRGVPLLHLVGPHTLGADHGLRSFVLQLRLRSWLGRFSFICYN